MIKLENYTITYDKTPIIKPINYEFKNNKLVCITGKSGSGKTSILNTIALLSNNYEGDIYINGVNNINIHSTSANNLRKDYLSYMFQSLALIENKTVLQNLKIIEKATIEDIDLLLEKYDIKHLKDKKIYTLSGGEQHRVVFIRLLLQDSEVVLLDEPGVNLDYENKEFLINEIIKLKNTKLIIVVSHDPKLVEIADEVIELEKLPFR